MDATTSAAPAAATATPQPTATAIDLLATKGATAAAEPKGGTPPAPAKPAAEEWFEVPVDGKTRKMTREELIKHASLGSAAHSRFEEAAKLRKQAETFLSKLRNPKDAISLLKDPKLGLNQEEIRSEFENWYKTEYIDREAMTPEQRRLADAEARIKAYEEQEAEKKRAEEAQEEEKQTSAEAEAIQRELIGLVEKSGLPKTKYTISRLAYWSRVNETKGIKAPPELLIQQVKKEQRQLVDSLTQASDGETLLGLLGEDVVKKLRKFDVERIRARRNGGGQVINQESAPIPEELKPPTERISTEEVRRRARLFK